jgi:hypothetical protein
MGYKNDNVFKLHPWLYANWKFYCIRQVFEFPRYKLFRFQVYLLLCIQINKDNNEMMCIFSMQPSMHVSTLQLSWKYSLYFKSAQKPIISY